jgi:hypothetical protein
MTEKLGDSRNIQKMDRILVKELIYQGWFPAEKTVMSLAEISMERWKKGTVTFMSSVRHATHDFRITPEPEFMKAAVPARASDSEELALYMAKAESVHSTEKIFVHAKGFGLHRCEPNVGGQKK